MRILLLCPYPERIRHIFAGDDVTALDEPLRSPPDADFLVSYGYRHILKEPVLSAFTGRIANLHISYLPWNRGADPNFWSWLDDTPKGVTLHLIDAGIDTGAILSQREVAADHAGTLRTTYAELQSAAVALLAETWPGLRAGTIEPTPQTAFGTFHYAKDKEPWWSGLPAGHDTPVTQIRELGSRHGARITSGSASMA